MKELMPYEIALERIEEAANTGAVELNLSNIGFVYLPAEIKKLTNLISLDLSGNLLQSLPLEIEPLVNLVSLNLSQNKLQYLPAKIGQLIYLTSLDLSENKLTSLPSEICQLINLTSLNIKGSQLAELPAKIGQLLKLTSLDLSENKLTKLPREIGQLTNLSLLNLFGNHLTSLPAEIGQLGNLTSLGLSNNKLRFLPAEIGKLVNLTSLDLSRNQLTSLPAEIGKLVNLTSLDLYSNQLTSLPAEIRQLGNLTSLNLYSNQLTSLPAEIGQLGNLTTLGLSNNKLRFLPAQIGQLVNLTSLDLSRNQLTSLPAEIGQLVNLTSLNLYSNQLTSLPVEIWQLVNLTSLTLSFNNLTTLPAEIGQLVNLTSLDLSGNDFAFLPIEIGKLVSLEELNIHDNTFIEIPAEIRLLKNLKEFIAYQNQFTAIPPWIGDLKNLEKLAIGNQDDAIAWLESLIRKCMHPLTNNKISVLPTEIQELQCLRELILVGNSLPIPPEILEKTYEPKAILDYYFSRLKRSLNECKVLVVGQGSVGKTSLIHRLLENKYDRKQNKTEGIDIRHFKFRAENTTYGMNVWDFGGQEIMHATHQFFLTKRSLYLLVLDSRLTQEENRVEYWLKMIQSFGGDSPVLVIGNKTDQHPLDIDRSGLQKKYPNIVGIFETSAATGVGMEGLRSAIAEQIHNLPHVRDLLPESWFMVKKQLEELGRDKNFINHDEFLSLCSKNEVGEESSQRTLIGFMHDLGVVLHFQDDPRLEALGILNPQWVTNGVYKILNAHELFQAKGVLTVSMLNEILNLPEYPRDKRLFIVDMMKKFELCYDITDTSFLVPDLLPKDEPFIGEWDGSLAFQYHYTVLPSSVITRFIVRMNEFIHKTVWRSGVVLKSGDNTALVKADMEDKKIYIWVNGAQNTRRDFLSAIRSQFDAIHKTITKLEVREKVPVPGQVNAEPVDYNLLLQMERKNVESHYVQAGNEVVEVNIRQLLNGVAREVDRQAGGNVYNINVVGNFDGNLVAGNENQVERKR